MYYVPTSDREIWGGYLFPQPLLPSLFEKIFLPEAVTDELRHDDAPEKVRRWAVALPSWTAVVATNARTSDPVLDRLDEGERAAIEIATQTQAELILSTASESAIA